VGFYTQETDQDNLTFGSTLFGGWIRSRTLISDNWMEMLRDNLFADVTTFLTEKRGIFDTQLLSING